LVDVAAAFPARSIDAMNALAQGHRPASSAIVLLEVPARRRAPAPGTRHVHIGPIDRDRGDWSDGFWAIR
jgi:hypothetical protein